MAGLLDKSVVSPTLIGRAEPLAALTHRLEAAARGQGQLILISGEAGIGKTRLVSETLARAARLGFTTLRGQCLEADRALPFGPFVDLLRGGLGPAQRARLAALPALALLLPELAPGPPPPTDKHGLFYALERFLFGLAEPAPLALLIEDLHWSDDASLEALLQLAHRLGPQPVLCVLTYRAEEVGPALGRFLVALNRARLAAELNLDPLTPAEVDALLRAVFDQARPVSGDFLDALYALTEGNPFFIEEVLKSLLAAGGIFLREGRWDRKPLQELRIPRSLDLAVQHRLDNLAPGARQVAALAAVAGRRFGFDLLEALTDMDEPTLLAHLKELAAAQLIVEESADAYAFRHALTREAVYATVLRRERQRHHRAIAQTLEHLHPGQLDFYAADLARHYELAGEWEPVRVYARRAGDRARAMHAPREAVEQYARAALAGERLGRPPAPDLLRARGQAHETLGEFDLARADLEQALALLQQQGDPRLIWQGLLDLGFAWAGQDLNQAGDYVRRALALAQTTGDPALIAHSLNRLGNWHTNLDQHAVARDFHAAALAHFTAQADRQGQAETLDLLGLTATMAGDMPAGLRNYEQAVALFEQLDDPRGLASGLSVMGTLSANYVMDAAAVAPLTLAQGAAFVTRSLEIARRIGWLSGEAYGLIILSHDTGAAGQTALALAQVEQGLALAAAVEHRLWLTYGHQAAGLALRDVLALPQARQHLEQTLALAREINSPFWIGMARAFLASVLILQGELSAARGLLAEGAGAPLATLADKLLAAARVELALAEGDPAGCEPELERLLAAVQPPASSGEPPWLAAPRLSWLRGQWLAAQKRHAEAVDVLESALRAAQAQGARALEWRIQLALGRARRAVRRFDLADQALDAARGLIETLALEAPPHLREGFRAAALGQLPASLPAAQRRAVKREFGGLTPREREVAALIGQGHSNRAIAERLVLSERTVESHVSHILAKLGLDSRTAIATWAQRLPR
jgi:DNA-binding CsgD family transcriptional regulator